MRIETKIFCQGLVFDIYVLKGNYSVEKNIKKLKKDDIKSYKKLNQLLEKIANKGIKYCTDEQFKFLVKRSEVEIYAIKIHGIRILNVMVKQNQILLLEFFKKKQNFYNKKNNERLKRVENKIEKLKEGSIL